VSFDVKRLYELLPAVYRRRDAEHGEPLRALLTVIAEQVRVLEDDLEQLYLDQFIETCAPWVVPYIGDLVGSSTLHGAAGALRRRAEVGNTLAYRRRKGTVTVLERLARDVTGHRARAVEGFSLLAWSQHMNHVRPRHHHAPDVRRWEPLEHIGSAFDGVPRSVDVRRAEPGRAVHNIPSVGVYLWRLGAYPLSDAPAFRLDGRRWLFDPLGDDRQLVTRPASGADPERRVGPLDAPLPISRRTLRERRQAYYGEGKSLAVHADGEAIGSERVIVCDLTARTGGDWPPPPPGAVAIDPVLGRIAFPADQPPPANVRVTFHYGCGADLGGGEYERRDTFDAVPEGSQQLHVPDEHGSVQAAFGSLGAAGGVVTIGDGGRYEETPAITAGAGRSIELRAASGRRPTLVVGGPLVVAGGEDAVVTLNGLLISGGALHVPAGSAIRRLRLRHCTLVPGIGPAIGDPPGARDPGVPSLVVEAANVAVEIDHCVLGGLRIAPGSSAAISDSIVDATAEDELAYAAPGADPDAPGGTLRIVNGTVIGKLRAVTLELVSNSILLARPAAGDALAAVHAERLQLGCVRFSYVPLEARVPRRYRCRPRDERESVRVRPRFTSLHYGHPGYGQLSRSCAPEVSRGADDEAEMGAFHDLYQPQRESNLRVRLSEYLRSGMDAGIFYAS
jgi:hypothetical protein